MGMVLVLSGSLQSARFNEDDLENFKPKVLNNFYLKIYLNYKE
jgi:hypothetical protein